METVTGILKTAKIKTFPASILFKKPKYCKVNINQHTRYHQMSIECQYMSNICQTQMKDKQNNETNKRNKGK